MEFIKTKLEYLKTENGKVDVDITKIKNYITQDLQPVIENLQLNNLFTKCLDVTPANNVYKFEKAFITPPDVFVITNKFKIQYDKSGMVLKKYQLTPTITKTDLTLDVNMIDENLSIPVCMLIIEKK